MNSVILVDHNDNEIGVEEKFLAHVPPLKLHRAFSIFILDESGQLLIQKRGKQKKTWPGFWSNSCCSHPSPNEPTHLAAKRRLVEELGFTCDLEFLFKFQYEAQFNKSLGEHEIDHVFLGYHNGVVCPNPMEVDDVRFLDLDTLRKDIATNPDKYTPWFRICFERFLNHNVRT